MARFVSALALDLAVCAVLLGCQGELSGTGPNPDGSTLDASEEDAHDDTQLETSTDSADAPADAPDDVPTCNAHTCAGACCGDQCIPRNCASACDAGAFFCPYDPGFTSSNGYCVADCTACTGATSADAGSCH